MLTLSINSSSGYIFTIYIAAFITSFVITSIIIIIRIRKVLQGTKISIRKSVLFSAYFIIISFFLIYNSFSLDMPITYAILYSIAGALSTYISYVHSKKSLLFWKQDSSHYVKGGLILYLLYVVALSIRIAINFLFVGYQEVMLNQQGDIITINRPIVSITTPELRLLSLIVTDTLLVIGVGLLIGSNLRVMKYYSEQMKNNNKHSGTDIQS
jgi:hypothetical protein